MCRDKVWCSFLGVLSLSSVLRKNIKLYYPDFGQIKYRLLWNNLVMPRQSYSCKSKFCSNSEIKDIDLLFCKISQNSTSDDKFLANHFVPLINRSKQNLNVLKRCIAVSQQSCSAKRKKEFSPFDGKNIFDYFKTILTKSSFSVGKTSLSTLVASSQSTVVTSSSTA